MHKRDIIVIGASAGGVEALIQLVQALPADLPASIFIVLHLAPTGSSVLPEILSRNGNLPAYHPKSGDPIEPGKIYVAPNNHHLLIKDGHVALSTGPRENGFRPSIDSLFRTAANTYGTRVVGVMLTGLLDDGSAGMVAVKAHGGIAVVQDPADAMFSAMPENALKVITADYILPLSQIPVTLVELALTDVPEMVISHNPSDETAETGSEEDIYDESEGTVSDLVCPDCGGVMVEFRGGKDNNLVYFKCRVGHRYALESMLDQQAEATEAALWAAVRALEESRSAFRRMEQYARETNDATTMERYAVRARDAESHADVIRQILLGQHE